MQIDLFLVGTGMIYAMAANLGILGFVGLGAPYVYSWLWMLIHGAYFTAATMIILLFRQE